MRGKSRSFQLSGFNSQSPRALVPNRWLKLPLGTAGSKIWAKGSFLILGLLLLSTNLLAQTLNFDQLKERFESGEAFVAEFEHTYTDSYTGESTSSAGEIWIDQQRYKLMAEGQTIVVDGETSRVYDKSRNRVIIDAYNPEDDDFAPSRMLSGIDSTYSVSEQREDTRTLITLTSNDDFAVFSLVEIILDTQLRPIRITAWDISDNEIVTNFIDGRFFKPDEGLFSLEYPDTAEVIDMRY